MEPKQDFEKRAKVRFVYGRHPITREKLNKPMEQIHGRKIK